MRERLSQTSPNCLHLHFIFNLEFDMLWPPEVNRYLLFTSLLAVEACCVKGHSSILFDCVLLCLTANQMSAEIVTFLNVPCIFVYTFLWSYKAFKQRKAEKRFDVQLRFCIRIHKNCVRILYRLCWQGFF